MIVWKLENLEENEQMSWASFSVNVLGLTNKQKKLSKFWRKKKKLSFGFREEKQGKTVKRLVKLEEKWVNVLG
jgi:hypothetical protein